MKNKLFILLLSFYFNFIFLFVLCPAFAFSNECRPDNLLTLRNNISDVMNKLRMEQKFEISAKADLLLRLRKPLTDAILLAKKIGLSDKQIKNLIDKTKETCRNSLTDIDMQTLSTMAIDEANLSCDRSIKKDPNLIKKYWIAFLEYNRLNNLSKTEKNKFEFNFSNKLNNLISSYPEVELIDLETKTSGEVFSNVFWRNLPKDIPAHEINYQKTNADTWTSYALELNKKNNVSEDINTINPASDGVIKFYNSIWNGQYRHNWIENKIPEMLNQHLVGRFKFFGEACKARGCDLSVLIGAPSFMNCKKSYLSDEQGFKAAKIFGGTFAIAGSVFCLTTGIACLPVAALGVGLTGMQVVETADSYQKYQTQLFDLEKGNQYLNEFKRDSFLKSQSELQSNATWLATSALVNPSMFKVGNQAKFKVTDFLADRSAKKPAVRIAIQELLARKTKEINANSFKLDQIALTVKKEYQNLPQPMQKKIIAMKKAINDKSFDAPELVRQNQITHANYNEELVDFLPADPKQSEALLDTFIELHKKSKMADYLEDLTAAVTKKMLNSGDPKLIAKAKAGELDQTTTTVLLVERMRVEGLDPVTINTFKEFSEFQQVIRKGPPVDLKFYGTAHGSLPHLIQIDYAKSTLKRGFGNLNSAFTYLSTNRGLKFWNEAFDQLDNSANVSFRDTKEIYDIVGNTLGLK